MESSLAGSQHEVPHLAVLRVDAIEKHTAAKVSREAYEREMGRTRESVLLPFRDGLESAARGNRGRRLPSQCRRHGARAAGSEPAPVLDVMGGVLTGLVTFPLVVFPIA